MKHWKRILSALLIGAMALTLFAGCDKKVKLEDELINQMADYYAMHGFTQTIVREKDNSIAETAFDFLSSHCTGALDRNFFGKSVNWKWTPSENGKEFLALLPDQKTSWYRISWTLLPSDPKSAYYKDSAYVASYVLADACGGGVNSGKNSLEPSDGSLTFENTIHVSMAQGQIGGYNYCLVIQRSASVS